MSLSLERALNVLLTVSAVALAAVAVRREVQPREVGPGKPAFAYDGRWREYLPAGEAEGSLDAPLVVIEFSDMQCPFCRALRGSLRSAKERLKDSLSTVFVHYPLPNHQLALPAAEAAECAREQGRFASFVDEVFRAQDSLEVIAWSTFAKRASVPDSSRFSRCLKQEGPFPRVASGKELGDRIDILATPTLFINGWRITGSLDDSTLTRAFTAILSGRKPTR